MWIKSVSYDQASDRLKKLYDGIKAPDGSVDNVMIVHSLRPHTMESHMALYRSVLHHPANQIPEWFLEMIGLYVSHLNRCLYCMEHHYRGFARALGDPDKAAALRSALESYEPDGLAEHLNDKERMAVDYVRKLTDSPMTLREDDVEGLRAAGWSDGEILEINQCAAYFSYANRTVQGLGVTLEEQG